MFEIHDIVLQGLSSCVECSCCCHRRTAFGVQRPCEINLHFVGFLGELSQNGGQFELDFVYLPSAKYFIRRRRLDLPKINFLRTPDFAVVPLFSNTTGVVDDKALDFVYALD